MSKKKSNRNRHTGHINAFKRTVIEKGKEVVLRDRIYRVFRFPKSRGYTVVRTT